MLSFYLCIVLFNFCCIFNQQVNLHSSWPCIGHKAAHCASGFPFVNISLSVMHAKETCISIFKFLVISPLYNSGSSRADNLYVKSPEKLQQSPGNTVICSEAVQTFHDENPHQETFI